MEGNKLSSNVIRVKLLKQKKVGLGFLVRKRSKTPHVVVSDLVAGGMATESGLVQIGDIVMKVNDSNLDSLEYDKAVEVLKSLPMNEPVILILRGPEGYTSHLETRFLEDGSPRTIRITKPILHTGSFIDRVRKTFSVHSSPKACSTKQTQATCECHSNKDTSGNGQSEKIRPNSVGSEKCTCKILSEPWDDAEALAIQNMSENNNSSSTKMSVLSNSTGSKQSKKVSNGVTISSITGDNNGQPASAEKSGSKSFNGPSSGTSGGTARVGGGGPCIVDSGGGGQNSSLSADSADSRQPHAVSIMVHKTTCENGSGPENSEGNAGMTNGSTAAGSSNVVVEGSKGSNKALDVGDRGQERRSSFSGRSSPVKKFVKLRNVANDRPVTSDTLHTKCLEETSCTSKFCQGSIMDQNLVTTAPRDREEVLVHANDFINQYYQSIKRSNTPAHINRWDEVRKCIEETGTYELTTAELTYGAKTAWRNAPRCIGRIQWSKLQLFDARHITTARGMFEAICNHIKYGTNKGNIRSAITVFPPRTDGKHDYRVWNSQFIRYAGYKSEDGTVVGDPSNVELTEICQKMGWRGKGTRFDVLPLILQANGHDPEMFDIPPELVLEVQIKHPKLPWFADLGLKWYALPAVSCLCFDCGGLQFTAAPFNGWFMGTEIGARDLCDTFRYNMLEDIAKRMGFDTRKSSSLWRDRTLVEINVAVLHSFQSQGVTITDHHAASESFMKHLDNEQKLRGGCPADWVWVVPPMSGSILPVFHQEMLVYKLKPSYEYQLDPWRTHVWKKDQEKVKTVNPDRPRRKIGFRELARAVKFSAKLMGKALARRVKCVILYATETGKSEGFAKTLCQIFKHAFDAKVMCMDEYDVSELEHEALVLIITSTFGNGDPPENGETFAKHLYEMKHPDHKHKLARQASYMRMSLSDADDVKVRTSSITSGDVFDEHVDDNLTLETGPLSNVRFSVFGLGSSAYPNFCAFANYADTMFHDLGAERICALSKGDELCGQEESFRTWAKDIFKAACDTFCTGDDSTLQDAAGTLSTTDHTWNPDTFRVTPAETREPDIITALSTIHGKNVIPCKFIERIQLQSADSDRQTMLVKLDTTLGQSEMLYVPGDHVAIFPDNSQKLVDAILMRLHNAPSPDQVVKVEMYHEKTTPLGSMKAWDVFARIPPCTLRMAFSRFLDVTTPPSQQLLNILAKQATKDCDRESLENLANDSHAYEEWKHENYPNIVHVLDQFPSLKIPPSLLLSQLPLLQSRFYSISSSLKNSPGEINATVAVVKYRTQGENGPLHEGVCSTWLNRMEADSIIPCIVRQAKAFHMPEDPTIPMILVGPGTGIAPFRSFWQQRKIDKEMSPEPQRGSRKGWGDIYLYFGCRNSKMDAIYKEELEQMKHEGVLKEVHTALSREPNKPKTYVQSLLKKRSSDVYRLLTEHGGHFYVCGDVRMASDVTATLERILSTEGEMTMQDAKNFILKLRDNNRFHEDIFGVTLRSSEVTDRARDQAKKAWNFINSSKSQLSFEKETVAPIPSGENRAPKGKPRAPQKGMYGTDTIKAPN